MAAFLPQETIRRLREGEALPPGDIAAFAQGMASGSVSDAQCAAFAMAVCWRGLPTADTVALTLAMRDSGERLRWAAGELPGPVLDKHSSGGVGDTVSLMLGPMLAACGAFVPMISGRGLGHTGGTLDKLEALPGYTVQPGEALLRRVVREAGVAIVGAGDALAPADRRLYAIRDVTATIDSVPLITASILSKKLAAGLSGLVLDVKVGNGAFMRNVDEARLLARSLVDVACAAGLPTQALLTDMSQPLAPCAGNAIETRLAVDYLTGRTQPARLHAVVLALGSALLVPAGLAVNEADAAQRLQAVLDSGAAAERFARMLAMLGGPADVLEAPGRHLGRAPVQRAVQPPAVELGRRLLGIDTRALGLAVIRLGGGRVQAGDRIDPAVGFTDFLPLGACAEAGRPLAFVHAASEADADAAAASVRAACTWADARAATREAPLLLGHLLPVEGTPS